MIYPPHIDMYRIMLLRIKRSVIRGGATVNAKPVLLIAIFELIGENCIKDNRVYISCELEARYKLKFEELVSGKKITPIYRPFFHLMNDGFWHLKLESELSPAKLTDKRLRTLTDYGFFDNALWDILQLEEVRNLYTKLLIDNFLKQ